MSVYSMAKSETAETVASMLLQPAARAASCVHWDRIRWPAPVGVQHRLEWKSLCRPAMRMDPDEIEVDGLGARQQPPDFVDMFAGMTRELRHHVGVAGIGEGRNFGQHGGAQRIARLLQGALKRLYSCRNRAVFDEPPQDAAKRCVSPV